MSEDGRIHVEFDTTSFGHGQISDDMRLINAECHRLVERWLEDAGCPEGGYKVLIRRRSAVDGLAEKFDKIRLDEERNMLLLQIKFGSRNDTCRDVTLMPPQGVSARLVHQLVSGTAAMLEYLPKSQHNKDIYEMILNALRQAGCEGMFQILVEHQEHLTGLDGKVQILKVAHPLLICTAKVSARKPGMAVKITCTSQDANAVADALCRLEQVTRFADTFRETPVIEQIRLLRDNSLIEGEAMKNEERAGYFAAFDLVMDPGFPFITRKTARQVYNRCCKECGAKGDWGKFVKVYLKSVKNDYTFKHFFFEWSLPRFEAMPTEGMEIELRFAAVGRQFFEAYDNFEWWATDQAARTEVLEKQRREAEEEVKRLEDELKLASDRLDQAREEELSCIAETQNYTPDLEVYRDLGAKSGPLYQLVEIAYKRIEDLQMEDIDWDLLQVKRAKGDDTRSE